MIRCKDCEKKTICGGATITDYVCPHCLVTRSSGSTYHPRLCSYCAESLGRCQVCCEVVER